MLLHENKKQKKNIISSKSCIYIFKRSVTYRVASFQLASRLLQLLTNLTYFILGTSKHGLKWIFKKARPPCNILFGNWGGKPYQVFRA